MYVGLGGGAGAVVVVAVEEEGEGMMAVVAVVVVVGLVAGRALVAFALRHSSRWTLKFGMVGVGVGGSVGGVSGGVGFWERWEGGDEWCQTFLVSVSGRRWLLLRGRWRLCWCHCWHWSVLVLVVFKLSPSARSFSFKNWKKGTREEVGGGKGGKGW